MIGLNPLNTKVLITTDEVIFHGPVENNPDIRSLLQAIIIAECRFIIPLIGGVAYSKLAEAKNRVVTDQNKDELQTAMNTGRPGREAIQLQTGHLVNSDTFLSDVQKKLWNDHLHKLTAECVVYVAMPSNRTRFTAAGMIKNAPNTIGNTGNTATIDLYELKHLMDRAFFNRINPLCEAMHQYMRTSGYPDFRYERTDFKRTGISLNMYNDDDEKCGCKW